MNTTEETTICWAVYILILHTTCLLYHDRETTSSSNVPQQVVDVQITFHPFSLEKNTFNVIRSFSLYPLSYASRPSKGGLYLRNLPEAGSYEWLYQKQESCLQTTKTSGSTKMKAASSLSSNRLPSNQAFPRESPSKTTTAPSIIKLFLQQPFLSAGPWRN